MKVALLVLIVGPMLVGDAFAAERKNVAEAQMTEFEITVREIPAVFARLKSKAENETFTVFVFSPGSGVFEPEKAINLQFCFENGSIGFDWVLLGAPNIKDRERYVQLATSLGYKVLPKEGNGVRYLRTTEGDLPRLCERVLGDLYGKNMDSKIGLLTRGIQWP